MACAFVPPTTFPKEHPSQATLPSTPCPCSRVFCQQPGFNIFRILKSSQCVKMLLWALKGSSHKEDLG